MRIRIGLYFLVISIYRGLGQDKPKVMGLDCCSLVRMSSTSYASEHQPTAMGNYISLPGKFNNRLVYKHQAGSFVSQVKKYNASDVAII